MKSEEDYYTRRMKKADAALPYIMGAGFALLLFLILTNLFVHS